MAEENDYLRDTFGLLASGSSGNWSVDVDESYDGTFWLLELDGPHVYFKCEIRDLAAIRAIVEYLRAGQDHGPGLPLDPFGATDVCFHWDNEGPPPRCFLIISSTAHRAVRVTLLAEDIAALIGALEQVLEELSAQS